MRNKRRRIKSAQANHLATLPRDDTFSGSAPVRPRLAPRWHHGRSALAAGRQDRALGGPEAAAPVAVAIPAPGLRAVLVAAVCQQLIELLACSLRGRYSR